MDKELEHEIHKLCCKHLRECYSQKCADSDFTLQGDDGERFCYPNLDFSADIKQAFLAAGWVEPHKPEKMPVCSNCGESLSLNLLPRDNSLWHCWKCNADIELSTGQALKERRDEMEEKPKEEDIARLNKRLQALELSRDVGWVQVKPAEGELISQEEGEAAVEKYIQQDYSTNIIRMNRGHWEDIVPIIAEAQFAHCQKTMVRLPSETEAIGIMREIDCKTVGYEDEAKLLLKLLRNYSGNSNSSKEPLAVSPDWDEIMPEFESYSRVPYAPGYIEGRNDQRERDLEDSKEYCQKCPRGEA